METGTAPRPPDPSPSSWLKRAVARAQADTALVAAHPWYAIQQGWVLTLDEKAEGDVPVVRPLPPHDYLHQIVDWWMEDRHGLLGKSRQMIISWLFSWLELWDAGFHEGRHAVIQGKREEDVDASSPHQILGRIRFIRQNLPPWLAPTVVTENVTSETYSNNSTIGAIPQGEDIVRGKVPSSMFMDEIAFQDSSEANWNAAVPAAGKLWGVTTPNGHEFLYRQSDPGSSWDDWRRWPSPLPGLHSYRNARGVRLIFVHYTADPANRTVEAQEKRRLAYTNSRIYARENEGDFTLTEGLGVFAAEFDVSRHVIPHYDPDPRLPLLRGWDTGYNGQSCAFMQYNNEGQLVWFDHILLKAVPLQVVAQKVRLKTAGYLSSPVLVVGQDGYVSREEGRVADYGDPAAESHHSTGESDSAVLSRHGIRLVSRPTTHRKRDLVEGVRHLLLPRSDGKPGLLVAKNSPDMDHVIAGFLGGYHYSKPKEGRAEKEIPHKDGFYDHIFDSAQYLVDNTSPLRYAYYEAAADMEAFRAEEPGIGSEGWERNIAQ